MEKAKTYTGDRLYAAIESFKKSGLKQSKSIFFPETLTPELIARHKKYYLDMSPDEEPLLVINPLRYSIPGLTHITGLVFTDKYLHFRLLTNVWSSWSAGKQVKGKIPLSDISEIKLKDNHVLSNPYLDAYDVYINGNEVGSFVIWSFFSSTESKEMNFIFDSLNQ